jgi:hypothetical protein
MEGNEGMNKNEAEEEEKNIQLLPSLLSNDSLHLAHSSFIPFNHLFKKQNWPLQLTHTTHTNVCGDFRIILKHV